MPHVIVKLYPGRTECQKMELTDKIVKAVMETIDAGESCISVSIEEIAKERWETEVYEPDIIKKENTLYKKPGYEFCKK
jgi:4-oxalocrotonate tautomerase